MKNPRNRARRKPTKAAPKNQIRVFNIAGEPDLISRLEMRKAAGMYRHFSNTSDPNKIADIIWASKTVGAIGAFLAGPPPLARN